MPTQFQMKALLAGETYPFSFTYPAGSGYDGLSFTYRELPVQGLAETIAASVADDLIALGVDPLAAVSVAISGEDSGLRGTEYLAYTEKTESFTLAEKSRYDAIMARTSGVLLKRVLGSWNCDIPLTEENCALLPKSIQEQVMSLSTGVTLSEDSKKKS